MKAYLCKTKEEWADIVYVSAINELEIDELISFDICPILGILHLTQHSNNTYKLRSYNAETLSFFKHYTIEKVSYVMMRAIIHSIGDKKGLTI